jgi:hypothetical protein
MFTETEIPFDYNVQITKASETPEGDWILEGPLSSERVDLEQEKVLAKAVRNGLATWATMGHEVDWDHCYDRTRDAKYLIGKAVEVYDGPCATGGTVPYAKTMLFKNKSFAKSAWEHHQAGQPLFYSISGGATRNGNVVVDTKIHRVALTTTPVNRDARVTMSSLAKSIANYPESPFTEAVLLAPVGSAVDGSVDKSLGADGSLWSIYVARHSPIFKALTAGIGAGLDSVGGRTLVREDVEARPHDKTCGCADCKRKRAKRKMAA